MAGTQHVARHFPFSLGRASGDKVRIEDEGVWENHVFISADKQNGYVLTVRDQALAYVNGHPIHQPVCLRNGDILAIGAVQLQFLLAAAAQKSFCFREWLTWTALGLLCLAQVALIYWLLFN
ncbi:MAG TPA: FHA domain-containing protein [Verrucomicrobiae bacterium]|jgi:hypothetical protein